MPVYVRLGYKFHLDDPEAGHAWRPAASSRRVMRQACWTWVCDDAALAARLVARCCTSRTDPPYADLAAGVRPFRPGLSCGVPRWQKGDTVVAVTVGLPRRPRLVRVTAFPAGSLQYVNSGTAHALPTPTARTPAAGLDQLAAQITLAGLAAGLT